MKKKAVKKKVSKKKVMKQHVPEPMEPGVAIEAKLMARFTNYYGWKAMLDKLIDFGPPTNGDATVEDHVYSAMRGADIYAEATRNAFEKYNAYLDSVYKENHTSDD